MKQLVTLGYLAVRCQRSPAEVLKVLQGMGEEPELLLNEQCYWSGEVANLVALAFSVPGGLALLERRSAASPDTEAAADA